MGLNFSWQDFMDCDSTRTSVQGKDTMHYYAKYGRVLLSTALDISYIRGDRMKRIILFVLGLNMVMCFEMAGMVKEESRESLTKQEIACEDKEACNSIDFLVKIIDAKDLELHNLDESISQYESIQEVYKESYNKLVESGADGSRLMIMHDLFEKSASCLKPVYARRMQISEEKTLLDTLLEELKKNMGDAEASVAASERQLMGERQVSQERAQRINHLEKQLSGFPEQFNHASESRLERLRAARNRPTNAERWNRHHDDNSSNWPSLHGRAQRLRFRLNGGESSSTLDEHRKRSTRLQEPGYTRDRGSIERTAERRKIGNMTLY